MAIKHLGWIALGGFAVGFVSLGAAYAAGGKELWQLDNIPTWGLIHAAQGSCGGSTTENAERRFAWTGGESVDIAVSGNVRYKVGDGDEVVIRGPQNLLDHVVVEGDDVKLDCRGYSRGNLEVTLPGIAFRQITIAGRGDLVGENLNQEALEINIGGKGTVRMSGAVAHTEVSIAGQGDVYLGDLAMKSLELNIAGKGNAEAGPTDSAEINIMGKGELRLLSEPKKLETNIMGKGNVIHAAPRATGI